MDKNKDFLSDNIALYDKTDNKGRTPMHLCAARGFQECTDYLLSISADPNIVDANNCNVHSYAWFCGNWNDQCPIQQHEEKKEYESPQKPVSSSNSEEISSSNSV